MKTRLSSHIAFAIVLFLATAASPKQPIEPWRPDQLMPPADLAAVITNPAAAQPVIVCVGPGAVIKGSIDAGPAGKPENLAKLKALLTAKDKKTSVVIYCGCCPFKNCPNIRPAFTLLNEMGFTNSRLLDLSHNVKTDWIDRHYPVNDIK